MSCRLLRRGGSPSLSQLLQMDAFRRGVRFAGTTLVQRGCWTTQQTAGARDLLRRHCFTESLAVRPNKLVCPLQVSRPRETDVVPTSSQVSTGTTGF